MQFHAISIDYARSVDGSEYFNYDINENISSLKYKWHKV
jgi:hypothetical protein